MSNRFCDTEIWQKDWFLELNTKQKLLVKFLFDNCDCAGFYKISWHLLKVYFNDCEITKKDFEKIKQVKFLNDNLIFLEDFALFQCKVKSFNDLNPKNNAHKGVLKLLEKYNIYLAPKEGLASPLAGAQDKDKDKEINTLSLYGEYSNVCLTKEHYDKLLGMCLSDKLLNELINSFSVNIEVGKERPYIADLPNAHYERLKSYYSYRKKNPDNFREKELTKNFDRYSTGEAKRLQAIREEDCHNAESQAAMEKCSAKIAELKRREKQ